MSQVKRQSIAPDLLRADFPILHQRIYRDKPLVYLDNGASTQHPESVIKAMVDCYEQSYANVHRGIHYLSERASDGYESARSQLATWIGAASTSEVIFTSGTTHATNLVAHAWGNDHLKSDDEIVLTLMEHHSNIVPWQQLANRSGAKIRWVGLTDDGRLDEEAFDRILNEKTKLVAICAVSNVLGAINPIKSITERAHRIGARVFVDAAQHVPHATTDVEDWGVDFLTFSGHKMLGPSGIGVLYGREALLDEMPPFLGGGSMISTVTVNGFEPGELPAKFEAGTPPIAQAIGLGAAVEYLQQFDMHDVLCHEQNLADKAIQNLKAIDGLRVLGPAIEHRAGIVSFVIEGLSNQDISVFLDRQGVAIRAGHHCAMPLHEHLGLPNSCRASFYLYNTDDEVQYFSQALQNVVEKLR